MKGRWDTLLTVTLLACALVTTGLVVRHEFSPPQVAARPADRAKFVAEWKSHLRAGERLGGAGAPVQLIEFGDFECPFCGSFYHVLKEVLERYPTQVSLTYVYFPLQGHRFALPAARVAECAATQGRFEAMYDALYEGQNGFGVKPWGEYATAAGVPNVNDFDTCAKSTEPVARIEQGKQLAKSLEIQGTPTLIINGWKLSEPPTAEQLDAMVKAILAGKSPISTKS